MVEDKVTEGFVVIDANEATEGLVSKDNNGVTTDDSDVDIEMM